MKKNSIRLKLAALVLCIIIGIGMVLTLVVTHYYRRALETAAIVDAEKTAHLLAQQSADLVLTNDRLGLHDLFDNQMKSNPSVRYIFLLHKNNVLAHTFQSGFPKDLIAANVPLDDDTGHIERIFSTRDAERYIDVAWPVFGGKAGVLRLGYGETAYLQAVWRLTVKIWLITFAVLVVALVLSHLLIIRMTRPIFELAGAVDEIDESSLPSAIHIRGGWEIDRLVNGFNHLIHRIRQYTEDLKNQSNVLVEKNMELDRVHQQTRASFEIASAVSELSDMGAIGAFLTEKLGETITCQKIALLVFASGRDQIYHYSAGNVSIIDDTNSVSRIMALAKNQNFPLMIPKTDIPDMILDFKDIIRVSLFPVEWKGEAIGLLSIGCPKDCRCVKDDFNVVTRILNLCAGAVYRSLGREEEIRVLRQKLDLSSGFGNIIGKNPKMKDIYHIINDVAPSDATILITGESGTGKELVARAIHDKSLRSQKPFVTINCAAYPDTLLESELFGYEKGAFTGAIQSKSGRFEDADGGTVFLDEIGEISPVAQVKLLRIIQSRNFERLGGKKTLSVNVRIIAATNRNLTEEIKKGRFREDLFFRLNVIPIKLPPLRERKNDIPLLVSHFIHKFKKLQNNSRVDGVTSEAMRVLLNYHWPGNVRELENCIEHAVILAKDTRIRESDLPEAVRPAVHSAADSSMPQDSLQESEKQHLIQTLETCNWNKTQAAKRLGIGRSSLYHKLKRLKIKQPEKN